ncbi:MAG: YcaO-like family protein [Pacificimonas sp.]
MKITGLPDDLSVPMRDYIASFPDGEIVAFPIGGIDASNIPVWIVALFTDDARLAGTMPYGAGYGATDEQAILGSLGEIAEMIFATLSGVCADPVRGSYDDLVRSEGERAIADPLALCLPAGSPVNRSTPLAWVRAKSWLDGRGVLVPVELAAYLSSELPDGYEPFTTVISNGAGAGPTLDWAIGHALCEIVQRDGNGLLFRALDRGVALEFDNDMPPAAAALRDRFEAAGIDVIPKYASDEFGIPNLYCVGVDCDGQPPVPIMATACGEGCHPDRETALVKALTEYAASRTRKAFAHAPLGLASRYAPDGYIERYVAGAKIGAQEPRALREMQTWRRQDAATLRRWLSDNMLSRRSGHKFSALPSNAAAGGAGRASMMKRLLADAGFDILYVDQTPPGAAMRSVKVIVPGMEVETMSYGRIGARGARKLIDMDSALITFDSALPGAQPIRMPPEQLATYDRPPLFDYAEAERLVGPLYPLYREPEAHAAAWADAKKGGDG